MSKWQPISTAPKKGDVLLYYPAKHNPHGQESHRPMVKIGRDIYLRRATHWMPLPDPPEAA